MLLQKQREEIIQYGCAILDSGLTKGTGGNLSIFDRESGYFAISPTGMPYHLIKPEDVVVMDVKGNIIDGTKKPSSEWDMHRIFYEKRPDIGAVLHTHTTFAATVSCMNWDLPAVHYMLAVAGINVRCAKYATFGTPELAVNAFEAMQDRRACLLANHGLLVGAADMASAQNITMNVEWCCELYVRAKSMGEPVILSDTEMTNMMEKFKWYGQVYRPEEA